MSTARSSDSPVEDAVDTTPFLSPSDTAFRRTPSLRGAARFLRRASSRRMLREPSMRVRDSAVEEIEERQSDWAYSKPIVILDLIWNVVFVMVSIVVFYLSMNESPNMPLRIWIAGYSFQCVVHMVCVWIEYRRRYLNRDSSSIETSGDGGYLWSNGNLNSSSGSDGNESVGFVSDRPQNADEAGIAKHLESANTMFSFIWWIIGFYWVSAGGQALTNESPQLYWLCITFLAFDVFFVVICVAVACVIGIAVCCCLPCIIALLYAVVDQEGASKDDIERLPKYIFRKVGDPEKQNREIQESFGGVMTECDTDSPTEHVLPLEDAECCICLCPYDDGVELRELPCRHHFHCTCIEKWLYINATCPLCKFNILKNGIQSGRDEA
jgi:hypothetical protein